MTRWLAAVAVLLTGPLMGSPLEITVGRAAVVVPEPEGLVALRNAGSPYFKMNAETQQGLGNRLLGAFVTQSEAQRAEAGRMPDNEEWAFALALPREDMDIPNTLFRREVIPALEGSLQKALSDPQTRARTNENVAKGVDNIKKEFGFTGEPDMDIGQMLPLGIYASTDTYFTYGATTKVSLTDTKGKRVVMPIVMVLSVVNVRNRIVSLNLYRLLRSDADVAAAKAKATAWARAATAANR